MKKPSVANSNLKPLETTLVFFIDRCLGNHTVPDALRNVGVNVEIHDDHFPRNAKDVDWLSGVGRNDWVVLTKDTRIRYRENEKAAVVQNDVRMFVIRGGDLSGKEIAEIFVQALPKMKRFLANNDSPFIAKITKRSVDLIYP